MPKIIENPRERLLEEAKKQIETAGYSAMTIRSVAKACGIGIGTVYNYFPSKDVLVATYMLEDWNRCIDAIEAVSTGSDQPMSVVRCMYDQLRDFSLRHRAIFQDDGAISGFAGAFGRYHGRLRSQLAQPLRKFCESDFAADFIAESLLTWTMADKSLEEICSIIEKLF